MKLTAFFLLSLALHVSAKISAQRVSLSEKKAPLEQVLNKISVQTGYLFVYSEQVRSDVTVTISVKNLSIEQALDSCLAGLPYEYIIRNKTVSLKRKDKMPEPAADAPASAFVDFSGRVIDERTKDPLVGASVRIKNTSIGTNTDKEGRFTLNVDPGKTIVISYIGYVPQEFVVENKAPMEFRLKVSNESIKDVVVTGLFTRKTANATGAVSTYTQADLMKAGNTNIIQSLKNLEPAFFVPENNLSGSNPNVLPSIQMRGQTGLPDVRGEYASNPNNPLFILDGIPVSLQTIMDLDMNRVKSATLLLDAASKAIYGSRAANGVMVIETLPPRAGKILLSYNTNLKFSAPDLSSYNLASARQKLEIEEAAGIYEATTGANTYELKQRYNEYASNIAAGINTYWLGKPVRNGFGQQHSLSIEGGEATGMRYQATLRYYNQTGVMKGSDRKTLTGVLRLTYRIRSFNFNNTLTVNDNTANNSPWGDFSQYALMNPYLPFRDQNGRILKSITNIAVPGGQSGGDPDALTNSAVYNPAYNSTLNVIDRTKYNQIINNFNMEWAILPEFRMNATFGITKQIDQGDQFLPADHTMFTTSEYSGANSFRKGRYTKENGEYLNYAGNLVFTYAKAFGKHSLTANLPLGISEVRSNSLAYAVEGFPNERIIDPAMALQYYIAGGGRPIGAENRIRRVESSLSANYAYDDRFLMDVTAGRSKGTDAGRSAPWSTNWSVGIGWNIHNEPALKTISWLDRLRVTANTGYVGADGFTSFAGLATYNYYTSKAYGVFGNGAFLSALANPSLAPQRTQEHGLEARLGVFKKISITYRYYIRNTDGLTSDVTTAPSQGFTSYKANLGKAQNKGFNANLNYLVFSNARTRNSLNLFLAVAHNTNKLVNVSNQFKVLNDTADATLSNSPRNRYEDGQSLTAIWAVPSLGIDPATGREVYRKKDGTQTYTWDAKDQIVAGDALPKYNGNFGLRLSIKGVELTTIFTYMIGGQQYNQTLADKVENADIYSNVDKRVLSQRWRKVGDVSFYKNIADFSITQPTTRFVEDRNSLTLGSLDMGYDLVPNVKKLAKIGFSRFRVGFTTTETFIVSTIRTERGIDYPFARDFSFNLNVSF